MESKETQTKVRQFRTDGKEEQIDLLKAICEWKESIDSGLAIVNSIHSITFDMQNDTRKHTVMYTASVVYTSFSNKVKGGDDNGEY